jgi:hypothetical protein
MLSDAGKEEGKNPQAGKPVPVDRGFDCADIGEGVEKSIAAGPECPKSGRERAYSC